MKHVREPSSFRVHRKPAKSPSAHKLSPSYEWRHGQRRKLKHGQLEAKGSPKAALAMRRLALSGQVQRPPMSKYSISLTETLL